MVTNGLGGIISEVYKICIRQLNKVDWNRCTRRIQRANYLNILNVMLYSRVDRALLS